MIKNYDTGNFQLKDDFLLSKNFLYKEKVYFFTEKCWLDIETKNVYKLSKHSNFKFFLMFLSFFYFFLNISKFKIIKGNQRNILGVRIFLERYEVISFLSFFSKFNNLSDIDLYSKTKINFKNQHVFIYFYFIIFKPFVNLYFKNDLLLDISEVNHLFSVVFGGRPAHLVEW